MATGTVEQVVLKVSGMPKETLQSNKIKSSIVLPRIKLPTAEQSYQFPSGLVTFTE